ncbi:hypothetical protein ACFSQ7_22830 [Paenibacillus rhizoplanae]
MNNSNDQYIGKQLVANLFNHSGVFVLPALTLLTGEHIRLITQHKIVLEPQDVVQVDSAAFYQLAVDDCTASMENIFLNSCATRRRNVCR